MQTYYSCNHRDVRRLHILPHLFGAFNAFKEQMMQAYYTTSIIIKGLQLSFCVQDFLYKHNTYN